MGRVSKNTLLGLIFSGVLAGGGSAAGLSHGNRTNGPTATEAPLERPAIEPTSAPGEGQGGPELERRPGRDDPNEFYKKPPRKPRTHDKMYA